jgi:hypothetical protein
MILSAYHFKGDADSLLEGHRRMMELFPLSGFGLHVAVTHEGGLTVYDSCPNLPTQHAFVTSPEFRLPAPTIEVLGQVHFAHLNQAMLR